MKAEAWQPGLAMRLAARSAARWPGASSGRPNTQPGAVRCAVLASIRQVFGFVTSAAASRGGRVGQAQEGHVGGIQQAGALGGVLALVGVDAQHLDVGALREILVDAQAGRAFLAVDEDAVSSCHGSR